ncbi:putative RNA methyltransferase [Pseudomaricurvus sp.]|uniref:putative RNA methyltransferase n=1 Tax=Pseudomaricurvus sp. TaxID=2004510 RepID=UPI003F6C98C7
MIWACPLCQGLLRVTESGVVCDANHKFDRAKQGYLHLLPAHHKRSQTPGDDRQMLLQRREFLGAGFYQPLAELLQRQWLRVVQSQAQRNSSPIANEPVTLLDSGCGEGYYLQQLQQASGPWAEQASLNGIDISKEAAKLAARSLSSVDVAVASGFQLPVRSDSVDVLLRVFAPGDSSEVARVLKPEGEFWRVVPGPEHLVELKQALYRDVKPHVLPEAPEGFELVGQENLRFPLHLDSNQAVRQLLEMTPFVWRGSREGKEQLQTADGLEVTAEFVLQRYRVCAIRDEAEGFRLGKAEGSCLGEAEGS